MARVDLVGIDYGSESVRVAGRELPCDSHTVHVSTDTGHDRLTIRALRHAAVTIDEDLFCAAVQQARRSPRARRDRADAGQLRRLREPAQLSEGPPGIKLTTTADKMLTAWRVTDLPDDEPVGGSTSG